jgi:protein TonB
METRKMAAPSFDAVSAPSGRALPRLAIVLAIHALALLALVGGDRIVRVKPPQVVMLLANVAPDVPKPPPPPPPRPRHVNKPGPPAHEAAAPPRPVIDPTPPRTDIVPTIVENAAAPVETSGGKPDGTGTAGAGDAGAGAGGAGGGTVPARVPVKVKAVLDPANCERPRLPRMAEERRLAGHVILAVLVDVDGRVTDARIARSSGTSILDDTALDGVRQCHFVAATVDKVPVPSWELFRFSWYNR